jgi:hypothetical protein
LVAGGEFIFFLLRLPVTCGSTFGGSGGSLLMRAWSASCRKLSSSLLTGVKSDFKGGALDFGSCGFGGLNGRWVDFIDPFV